MNANEMIKEIAAVYGAPKSENPQRYLAMMEEAIGAFDPPAIELACDAFLQEWTYRRWPTPAEIRGFLTDASARVAKQAPSKATKWKRGVVWISAEDFTERWFARRADPVMIDRAEREGWTPQLWNWVKTQAHSILAHGWKNGGPTIEPSDDFIRFDGEGDHSRADYYRDRAEAYRLAAEYQKSPKYQAKHGKNRKLNKAVQEARKMFERTQGPRGIGMRTAQTEGMR